jgi:hypothetical protein
MVGGVKLEESLRKEGGGGRGGEERSGSGDRRFWGHERGRGIWDLGRGERRGGLGLEGGMGRGEKEEGD